MPVLPQFVRRSASAATAAIASDTRILDSRQLRDATSGVTQAISRTANDLLRRRPQSRRLEARQDTVAIPQVYKGLNSGPSPGAVVGIVVGSVIGFLLLIWLLWSLSNGSSFIRTSNVEEEDVYISRRRSRSPRSRRSSRRTEMTSRSPDRRRERVIRQTRVVRDVPNPPREASRIRETVIVDEMPRGPPPQMERRVEGDDIVEVIEEHSSIGGAPPPPRTSRTRRSSGYRSVNPSEFGGGDYPFHEMER